MGLRHNTIFTLILRHFKHVHECVELATYGPNRGGLSGRLSAGCGIIKPARRLICTYTYPNCRCTGLESVVPRCGNSRVHYRDELCDAGEAESLLGVPIDHWEAGATERGSG